MSTLTYLSNDMKTTISVSPKGVVINGNPDTRRNLDFPSFIAIDVHHYQQRMLETGDHDRSIFAARYRHLPYQYEGLGKDFVSGRIVFVLLDMMKYQNLTGGRFEYASDTGVIKYCGVKRSIAEYDLDGVENIVRELVSGEVVEGLSLG